GEEGEAVADVSSMVDLVESDLPESDLSEENEYFQSDELLNLVNELGLTREVNAISEERESISDVSGLVHPAESDLLEGNDSLQSDELLNLVNELGLIGVPKVSPEENEPITNVDAPLHPAESELFEEDDCVQSDELLNLVNELGLVEAKKTILEELDESKSVVHENGVIHLDKSDADEAIDVLETVEPTIEIDPENQTVTDNIIKPVAFIPNEPELIDLDFPSLVTIQAHGERPPLFLVHDLDGYVTEYCHLAEFLGDDQPVYGLQARGVYGKLAPLNNISEMASAYLAEVQKFCSGPIQIGGYSIGGWIAYEMANQFIASGNMIDNLIIFDARADFIPQYIKSLTPQKRIEYRLNYAKQRINHHWNQYSTASSSDKFGYISSAVRNRNGGMRDGISGAYKSGSELVRNANRYAIDNFVPKRFAGDLVLFKSMGDGLHSHYGWQELVDGSVQECMVPGEHSKILQAPFVQSLANLLKPILK
ncbi:MAG: thioesterase domain-containing protein, partial [Chloroflexota bacterium]